MILYPAIDLYKGRVVRLSRGDFNAETIYSDYPADKALEWEEKGADWIHVVDLEGAKTGEARNFGSLMQIRRAVKCRIQYGGGIRTAEYAERVLNEGIDRVVIGTKALDEKFFNGLLQRFGSRIALGLDTREGKVQTDGWLKESGQDLRQVLERLNDSPLKTVIYTDIQKDGMLEGPNLEGLQQVLKWTRAGVILSGGISRLEDIKACAALTDKNFDGAIIGKALYEKRFTLEEALGATGKKAGGTHG